MEIDRVEVDYEKCIITHPEYRSIRLDVYVKDEKGTRYNIEMQVASEKLEKRTRYYHSQMDLDMLSTSVPYEELPDSYVIFICNFDPFGEKKYCYTVKKCFWESPTHLFNDGSYTIFLNTQGTNRDEISDDLYDLLSFIRSDKDSLMRPTENTYIHRLQDSITEIKRNRIWGDRFMRLEELIEREKRASRKEGYEDGKSEGLAEGKAEGLAEGKAEGLAEGKAEGLAEGKAEGLAEGKAEGLAEGKALTLSHFKASILTLARSKNCDASFLKKIETCDNPEELVSLHEECFKFDH